MVIFLYLIVVTGVYDFESYYPDGLQFGMLVYFLEFFIFSLAIYYLARPKVKEQFK